MSGGSASSVSSGTPLTLRIWDDGSGALMTSSTLEGGGIYKLYCIIHTSEHKVASGPRA